jgi:hypothetical protein
VNNDFVIGGYRYTSARDYQEYQPVEDLALHDLLKAWRIAILGGLFFPSCSDA